MDEAGLTRSMSKKGCSPDNSACEGFFGRMKNEMFYGEKWDKISVEEFISIINQYMQWYRDKRIKLSLGGLSPMEYRRFLGPSNCQGSCQQKVKFFIHSGCPILLCT